MEKQLSDQQLKSKLSLATDHARQGRLDDAMPILKEIIAVRPNHEISLGMLASIYLQIGMHEEAVEKFEALLRINSDNPLARFQLGMTRLSQGNPERAVETWEPMLGMKNEFMANFHSALALIQLGRQAEALPLLERTRENMPDSHPLFPKLLEIQSALND